jgi:hypothetical protein
MPPQERRAAHLAPEPPAPVGTQQMNGQKTRGFDDPSKPDHTPGGCGRWVTGLQRVRSFAAEGQPLADWHKAVADPGDRGAHSWEVCVLNRSYARS